MDKRLIGPLYTLFTVFSLLLSAVLVVVFISPTSAVADDSRRGTFNLRYDLDSTDPIYCTVLGPGQGHGKIKTTGSSQNVTEVTAGSNPFRSVSVGDVIAVDITPTAPPVTVNLAYVITVTDAANIVVNPAVDWSAGYPYKIYKQSCGTGTENGWLDFSGMYSAKVTVEIKQMNATAVLWRVECKDNSVDSGPNVVYPGESSDCGLSGTLSSGFCRYTAASTNANGYAGTHAVDIPEIEGMCRVGIKIDTDDGGDLTTNAEQITARFEGRIQR